MITYDEVLNSATVCSTITSIPMVTEEINSVIIDITGGGVLLKPTDITEKRSAVPSEVSKADTEKVLKFPKTDRHFVPSKRVKNRYAKRR